MAHLPGLARPGRGWSRFCCAAFARWAQKAQRAGDCAESVAEHATGLHSVVSAVVEDMVRLGAVDDAVFARSRVRRLVRSGRSARAVQAHLAAKGVAPQVRDEALDMAVGTLSAAEQELCAALVLARKRRLGPFATEPATEDEDDATGMARRNRALGVLARAGFARDVAQRVLEMQHEEAEEWMDRLRAES